MRNSIIKKEIKLNLIAGIRKDVYNYYLQALTELCIPKNSVTIVYSDNTLNLFNQFSNLIRTTDVLWTKPNELCFFCALGIPVIMSDPTGFQEQCNRKWLMEIQAGITQDDPEYANQWLFDLWRFGRLAESAWDGFLKARKFGTFKIEEVLKTGTMVREVSPLRR